MVSAAASIFWLWRWKQWKARLRKDLCLHCGYELTGNTSGVCPECGESIRAT